jgi:PST family polysaccharide transporter
MVTPLVAFLALFQDFGLQAALIQRREVNDAQINQLYWLNLTFACLVAAVLLVSAPIVGWFYGDARVTAPTMAFAAPAVLGGLASQQYALLARNFRFVTLAALDVACAALGFAVAVIVGLMTHSFWALWASAVASSGLWVIASTLASGWRPSAPRFRGDTAGMLTFGVNVTAANVLFFFMRNLDNVLIGKRWGAPPLGLYDRAYKLLLFPLQNVNAPVMRAVVPILSRLQDDRERLCRAYLRIVTLVCLATVPGMAAALAAPDEVVRLLLGPSWADVATIFVWLGIAGLVQPLTNTVSWLLTAQGRTGELLRFSIAASVVTIAAFLIGLPGGPIGVARAYAVSELVFRLPASLWLASRKNPIAAIDFAALMTPLLLAAAVTFAAAAALRGLHLPIIAFLIADALVAYVAAVACVYALPQGRAAIGDAIHTVQESLRARRARPA